MSEELMSREIEGSLRNIERNFPRLGGVANSLLASPQTRIAGSELQRVQREIEHELDQIREVLQMGRLPHTAEEEQLGRLVQDAAEEVTQI